MSFKKYKLKEKEFKEVLKKGKTLRFDSLVLKIRKNNLGKLRFGILISKKIAKKAVERNKIKRRLREAIIEKIKNLKKSSDLVFICLPGIEKKDLLNIKKVVNQLFQKVRI